MTRLRVVFMGTPEFAVPALESLEAAGHDIVCVYSQPPRRAGRGQKERPSPVEKSARQRGIPVRTPRSLKDESEQEDFAALKPDIAVVAAYGLILPAAVLHLPRLGCINIHASLLPRWRGAAPINRAILAGDEKTGVTIMAMDEGLDTGAMLLSDSVLIGPKTTAGELTATLAAVGARLVLKALDGLEAGTLQSHPQPQEGVTYAPKLTREEERLDWREKASVLERKIRAFAPSPGTWFDYAGERIRVMGAESASGSGKPGTVLDGRLAIACGEGALRPVTVQRAGRAALAVDDYLRGKPIPPGTVLPVPD